MPKYLIQANYTVEGVKGVLKEGGSGRRAAIEKMANAMGGKMEAFYFAFGETDVYVIVELPDNASAAAVGLAVNAAGGAGVRTTVLLTPEDIDAAAKKHPGYRPPGQS
jgi:uncharacterized protein with GYD domain